MEAFEQGEAFGGSWGFAVMETDAEIRDREKFLDFLKWLRDRGFELAKCRQLNCGEYVWLPISDPVYTVEIEGVVGAYMFSKRGGEN